MKKIFIAAVFSFLFAKTFFSLNFDHVDTLYEEGKYEEGVKILEKEFSKSASDPEIIWRISRFYFELAEEADKKSKKDKIALYTKAMDVARPFLDISYGDKLTRAEIIFWYAASYGSRGEVIGIKESLDTVPELFSLADKAIALDPTFAPAYLLKGRIDSSVPSFLGGDKFRMGVNIGKALYYNSKDMSMLVDSANAFLNRDWEVKKKNSVFKKSGPDGNPADISDKDYAKKLLGEAVELYKTFSKPTKRDGEKFREALDILKKLK
jgi:tetratricopeptide (TPR) repeat protein